MENSNVIIRRGATLADIPGMLKAEHEAWPEEQAFTEEHFLSHLEVFPEGIFLAEVNGEIAGVGISEILKYDINNPISSWYEVSDMGFIRKTHDPLGNVLYGVSLSVSPRFSASRLGRKMLAYAQNYVINRNLESFVIGSRVPRFHKFAENMTIEEYISLENRDHYLDPEVEFYSRCGFKPVRVLENYFEDKESLNYGVLMVWQNTYR